MKLSGRAQFTILCLFLFSFALVVFHVLPASAARYVDPRRNLGGYKSWCAGAGGHYDYNGGNIRCIPGAGTSRMNYGGYNFGGYNPYQQMFGIMGNALGKAMSCAMDPNCNGSNKRRRQMRKKIESRKLLERKQARLQAEHLRQEFEREQKEVRREENERRRKMESARKRIFGVLKGGIEGSEAFRLKTNDGTAVFKIKEENLPIGPSSDKEREDCTAYFIQLAEEAGGQGNFSEASFLSKQAGEMLKSGAADVQCSKKAIARAGGAGPIDPVITNAVKPEDNAIVKLSTKEILQRHSKLYGKLYHRADKERDAWIEKSDDIDRQLSGVKEAEVSHEEAKVELARLEELNTKARPGTFPPGAMMRARAKIMKTKKILDERQGTLLVARRNLSNLGEKMKKTGKMFESAAKGPEEWGRLIKQVNLGG
ncbi:MAG: hypothetical protein HOC91_15740 [Nitrospinaceae bacterium]|jgi:hypothetical protein|nr:hypothetical protein [Nitrospinaceae bacterium]MBT3432304.1 hypothetical protein [Nitrospinaceae bacterium]MBT4431961.1 hypothetical protein [Nitrospinaceae bacterium]MBT5369487.1 hypothetical protein [Nitrospinaceae bacterium]MBT6394374.1 hypothetical protein [Nitrospinaceae bacterium]